MVHVAIFDVFGFELSVDALETGRRGDPEPGVVTLEAFGRDVPEA